MNVTPYRNRCAAMMPSARAGVRRSTRCRAPATRPRARMPSAARSCAASARSSGPSRSLPSRVASAAAVAMTAAARNSAVASRPRPAGSTRLSTSPIAPPTPAAAAPRVGVREFAVSSRGPSTVRGSDALSADSRKRLIDRFTRASTYTAGPTPVRDHQQRDDDRDPDAHQVADEQHLPTAPPVQQHPGPRPDDRERQQQHREGRRDAGRGAGVLRREEEQRGEPDLEHAVGRLADQPDGEQLAEVPQRPQGLEVVDHLHRVILAPGRVEPTWPQRRSSSGLYSKHRRCMNANEVLSMPRTTHAAQGWGRARASRGRARLATCAAVAHGVTADVAPAVAQRHLAGREERRVVAPDVVVRGTERMREPPVELDPDPEAHVHAIRSDPPAVHALPPCATARGRPCRRSTSRAYRCSSGDSTPCATCPSISTSRRRRCHPRAPRGPHEHVVRETPARTASHTSRPRRPRPAPRRRGRATVASSPTVRSRPPARASTCVDGRRGPAARDDRAVSGDGHHDVRARRAAIPCTNAADRCDSAAPRPA